ncbi:MAG: Hsp33 family molecular chaperone HslO, partial [Eubacterium sp.]
DIGLKEPYVGNSPIISGEIAEDLTYYYAISEQTPTSIALGVTLNDDHTVSAAGGFIIQLMPFCDDYIIDQLEKKLSQAPSVTELLSENPDPAVLLNTLLGDFDLKVGDTLPTSFTCDCSKEKVTKALISVGEKDLLEMIHDGKTIEVNCDFCGTHYYFEPVEIELILKTAQKKTMEKFHVADEN